MKYVRGRESLCPAWKVYIAGLANVGEGNRVGCRKRKELTVDLAGAPGWSRASVWGGLSLSKSEFLGP